MMFVSKQKPILNVLILLCIFFLWLGITCANKQTTPIKQGTEATGGIYGAIQIKSINHYAKCLSPTLATVYIQGTDLSAKPDSTGIFYFPNVKAGNYTLIGRASEFADYIVEGVEVSMDSISILKNFVSLFRQTLPEKDVWSGIKINRIDIHHKGSMAGRVYDIETGQNVKASCFQRHAYVIVKGTFWGAEVDSSGNFRINNLLPGKYEAFSGCISYHQTVIYGIRIAPDSISIVDFGLRPNMIPEGPLPREWQEQFLREP